MVGGLAAQAALIVALGCTGGDARWAVRYNPGVMEHVAVVRHLPITPCMFAHPTLPIGTWAYIRGVRTGHMERCRVTDTSADADRARHIRLRRVELGYDEALRICPPGWQGKAMECEVWVIPE